MVPRKNDKVKNDSRLDTSKKYTGDFRCINIYKRGVLGYSVFIFIDLSS